MTTATPTRNATIERVAAFDLGYKTITRGPLGERQEVHRNAVAGDPVVVSWAEAARLEALGALAPAGTTGEEVLHAIAERKSEYEDARRQIDFGADG
jgi:hypothetical protein